MDDLELEAVARAVERWGAVRTLVDEMLATLSPPSPRNMEVKTTVTPVGVRR
jgi:hypothetical protein